MKLIVDYDVWQTVIGRDPDAITAAEQFLLDHDEIVINLRHGHGTIQNDEGTPTHVVWSHPLIDGEVIEAVAYLFEQIITNDPQPPIDDPSPADRQAARARARRAARLEVAAAADDDKTYRQQLTRARRKLAAVIDRRRPRDVVRFWRDEIGRLEPLAQAEREAIRQARQAAREARGEQARELFFADRAELRKQAQTVYNKSGEGRWGDLTDEQKDALVGVPALWQDLDDETKDRWLTQAALMVGHPGVTGS